MRATYLLPLVPLLACLACHPPPPDTSEHVQFQYAIGSAMPTLVRIEFDPGTQPCGRMIKEINITAQNKTVYFRLLLHQSATMPAGFVANSKTDGVVNLDVKLPVGAAGDSEMLYATGDPNGAFSCFVRFGGPDPFAEFDGTFHCSGGTGPNQVNITGGDIMATMCEPI